MGERGSGTLSNLARYTGWHQQREGDLQSPLLPLPLLCSAGHWMLQAALSTQGLHCTLSCGHAACREAAEQHIPLKDSANVYKSDPENPYLPQLLLPALKTGFSGAKQEQFFP